MVDLDTKVKDLGLNIKIKDLIEMKFGPIAQEIIDNIQESISNNESFSELRERIWQNVVKPKIKDANVKTFLEGYFPAVQIGIYIPEPSFRTSFRKG